MKPLISVVSPVYKAEKIVNKLVERLTEEISKITFNFEIILIEDGSPDKSWEEIEKQCSKFQSVKGIKLSRNFGQHVAITAGLQISTGDFVVVMDCDLQDNPKYISDLYYKALDGYDIVYTSKKERNHQFIKNFFAEVYFKIFNYLSDNQNADSKTGAYSILTRKVVNAFCAIKDHHRHYLMVLRILGYKSTRIEVRHDHRFEGKSSYNFIKLLELGINGIVSQSDKLLRISITLGFTLFGLSIIWSIYLIYLYFYRSILPGYTSLMVMIILSTGLILMSIGIAGLYISKIFDQVKNRPLYFIDKTINFSE